ncbi:MAG: hypothetical protein H3C43_02305, partial [Leptonema sp. (in: Bacteria)]|nr:hypothetical protein [Leptonema sp. (in: bacteria)]
PEFTSLTNEDQEKLCLFAGILRVAIGLSRTEQGVIKSINAKVTNKKDIQLILQLTKPPFRVRQAPDISYAVSSAELRKDLLEKALHCNISILIEEAVVT